ncbi:MAG: hypothetical protein C4341_03250 [Armatimonadota bacterium]
MERAVRIFALVALFILVVAGCAKDVVSRPDGSGAAVSESSTDVEQDAKEAGAAKTEEGRGTGATSVAAPDEGRSSNTATSSGGTGETPKVGPGEVVLRCNLKKGQKYSYEMKTVMDMMGQSATIITDFAVSVMDVKGDKFTVEYKFGDTKVTASDPQMKSLIEQRMAATKGSVVTADIDRRGQMTNVSGVGAEMLKGMGGMSAFGYVFPEKALRVGDSWTHTIDLPGMAGSEPIKMNIRLTGASENLATLAGSGTHTMEMSPPGGQQQGGSVSVKSTFSSTTKVDMATGMIVESSGTITTTVSGGGMGGQSQKIAVTLKRK